LPSGDAPILGAPAPGDLASNSAQTVANPADSRARRAVSQIVACRECDLLQRAALAAAGSVGRCHRCGATLFRIPREGGIERAVALLSATLILFAVAQTFPILTMRFQDHHTAATLLGGVYGLYREGMALLAGVVLLTGFLLPLAQLLGMLAVLFPFYLHRRPRYLRRWLRIVEIVSPWSMLEVYLLGVLVALVKLGHLATVAPGIAIWAFGLLILLLAAAETVIDPHALWARLEGLE
jgi:paraquat-inducible protein A